MLDMWPASVDFVAFIDADGFTYPERPGFDLKGWIGALAADQGLAFALEAGCRYVHADGRDLRWHETIGAGAATMIRGRAAVRREMPVLAEGRWTG
jgi:hypothetical protein